MSGPRYCEIHQHHKWCEHNGGVMGPTGWESPEKPDRPKWTKAVQAFLDGIVIDPKYEYPEDGSADWLLELVEEAVNAIFCNTYGHQIEDDQCMKPEHRYCVWCGRRANVIAG